MAEVALEPSWKQHLSGEFTKPYMQDLRTFLKDQKAREKVIYPKGSEFFAALNETPFESVKVMILGQDPYHGPKQAHGLCFSVQRGVRVPPSLINIHKELATDLEVPIPTHGNLEHWARQGVLLLNTTLTVRAGQAASHQGKGWETFTDRVIRTVSDKPDHVVFI